MVKRTSECTWNGKEKINKFKGGIRMIRNYLDKKGFEFKQGNVKKTFGIQVSMISEGIDSGAVYSIIKVIGNEYNRILADELFENCAEDMKGGGNR